MNYRGKQNAGESGSALLAVLWLSAALAAIAFSVAMTVRAETERTSNFADSTRAYYLAAGSIDRAILWILRGPPTYQPPMPYITMDYPGGQAVVEVIPETSKLGINEASVEDLTRLVAAAGADPGQARYIAEGIIDWRTPGAGGAGDQEYLRRNPSFRARHASFEEIEELLLVRGMTPELFYGSYFEGQDGRLIPRGGLKDCLSVWGPTTQFDANTADPVLLMSLGMTPQAAFEAAQVRRIKPFHNVGDFAFGPAAGRLRIGGNVIWTLRATARLKIGQGRLSELSRTVSATVKFLRPEDYNPPYHFLRWYGDAWAPSAARPLDFVPGGALPGILSSGTPR
ncbi:MAG: hypothetical protein ABI823_10450 [Bryobacteraceae bacterium]